MAATRTFVLYEDRPQSVIGVKLASLSLLEHVPGAQIRVHLGGDARTASAWFAALHPSVAVDTGESPDRLRGWNVKPDLLLAALRGGCERAVWIDSDVIVCGPLGARLDLAGRRLVATEDMWYGSGQGSGDRTRAWGLDVGRTLPATLNTALLQVNDSHVDLLETWRELLRAPEYRQAQSSPYRARPQHLVGDQDVITAMIESTDWSHVDVDLLSRGIEIAQCYGPAGFSPRERFRVGPGRLPLAVHAMGPKPWSVLGSHERASYWNRTHMQLTPYTSLAARYGARLPGEMDWTNERTIAARILRRASGGDPVTQELPLAAAQSLHWRIRQDAGRVRRRLTALGHRV